jgi:hypothetical protein
MQYLFTAKGGVGGRVQQRLVVHCIRASSKRGETDAREHEHAERSA